MRLEAEKMSLALVKAVVAFRELMRFLTAAFLRTSSKVYPTLLNFQLK